MITNGAFGYNWLVWAVGRQDSGGREACSVCSLFSSQPAKAKNNSGVWEQTIQCPSLPDYSWTKKMQENLVWGGKPGRKKCGSVEPRGAAAAALMATRAIDPIGHTQDTPHRDRCRGKSKESLRNTSGKLTSKSPKSTPESDTRLNAAWALQSSCGKSFQNSQKIQYSNIQKSFCDHGSHELSHLSTQDTLHHAIGWPLPTFLKQGNNKQEPGMPSDALGGDWFLEEIFLTTFYFLFLLYRRRILPFKIAEGSFEPFVFIYLLMQIKNYFFFNLLYLGQKMNVPGQEETPFS